MNIQGFGSETRHSVLTKTSIPADLQNRKAVSYHPLSLDCEQHLDEDSASFHQLRASVLTTQRARYDRRSRPISIVVLGACLVL